MENNQIMEFANIAKVEIKKISGKNNQEIKDKDFGYFKNKENPRLFLMNHYKGFIEAFCLCDSVSPCARYDTGEDKIVQGFGHNVNNYQKDYFVIGNIAKFL